MLLASPQRRKRYLSIDKKAMKTNGQYPNITTIILSGKGSTKRCSKPMRPSAKGTATAMWSIFKIKDQKNNGSRLDKRQCPLHASRGLYLPNILAVEGARIKRMGLASGPCKRIRIRTRRTARVAHTGQLVAVRDSRIGGRRG